jgi:hypothetical protein
MRQICVITSSKLVVIVANSSTGALSRRIVVDSAKLNTYVKFGVLF